MQEAYVESSGIEWATNFNYDQLFGQDNNVEPCSMFGENLCEAYSRVKLATTIATVIGILADLFSEQMATPAFFQALACLAGVIALAHWHSTVTVSGFNDGAVLLITGRGFNCVLGGVFFNLFGCVLCALEAGNMCPATEAETEADENAVQGEAPDGAAPAEDEADEERYVADDDSSA